MGVAQDLSDFTVNQIASSLSFIFLPLNRIDPCLPTTGAHGHLLFFFFFAFISSSFAGNTLVRYARH